MPAVLGTLYAAMVAMKLHALIDILTSIENPREYMVYGGGRKLVVHDKDGREYFRLRLASAPEAVVVRPPAIQSIATLPPSSGSTAELKTDQCRATDKTAYPAATGRKHAGLEVTEEVTFGATATATATATTLHPQPREVYRSRLDVSARVTVQEAFGEWVTYTHGAYRESLPLSQFLLLYEPDYSDVTLNSLWRAKGDKTQTITVYQLTDEYAFYSDANLTQSSFEGAQVLSLCDFKSMFEKVADRAE